MLALSPATTTLFSNMRYWPSEMDSSINHNSQNNKYFTSTEYPLFSHQFTSSSPPQSQFEAERSTTPSSDDPTMVKKLNHNASERDRRKRINNLYSSLRLLLPLPHQSKKMSIPATISRVIKYIPELQEQVEGLAKKKEELLSRISRQGDAVSKESERKNVAHHNFASVVSTRTSRLSDSEVAIQISYHQVHKSPLSQILLCLENYGLALLNASSFETFGGRVFYNLHFHVEKHHRLDSEILSDKLSSIYEKKQRIF